MKGRNLFAIFATMLFVSAAVLAGEAPEVVDGGGVVPWYGHIQLWEVLGGLLVAALAALKGWAIRKDGKKAKIADVVEAAVIDVYDEFVREAKAKADNGKLTNDQIKKARDKAWAKAKLIGKARGLDLAKEIAAEYVPMLINKAVSKLKNKDK